jgi:hypothetical protein
MRIAIMIVTDGSKGCLKFLDQSAARRFQHGGFNTEVSTRRFQHGGFNTEVSTRRFQHGGFNSYRAGGGTGGMK